MTSQEIRKKFIQFFELKGHKLVPASSLLPKDDPSVLLTTAGMQQFKPYFVGLKDPAKDFGAINVISIQPSFRTADIDDVGNETHLTFFEMLGNFSFGGYWKQAAIEYAWEFLTDPKWMGIDKSRIAATYYNGNRPKTKVDMESEQILKAVDGLVNVSSQPDTENFWGPTGDEGPCGPTVEFHVDGVEIWNLVFNEFYCNADGSLISIKTQGVDTGMGFERLLVAVNNLQNVFETDGFLPIMKLLSDLPLKSRRIVADHIRGVAWLMADHIRPSNKEEGYVLRRILRRVLLHIHGSGVTLEDLLNTVIDAFKDFYPALMTEQNNILQFAREEADKFSRTIDAGKKELNKVLARKNKLTGQEAFDLFASYGLPIDFIKEQVMVDEVAFEVAFAKHRQVSRAGVKDKFGGHGLSAGATVSTEDQTKITQLHTATHLLHEALKQILGPEVHQAGSDTNSERTRFDFNFPRKVEPDEIAKIEAWVNDTIQAGFYVTKATMPQAQAIESGAYAFFKERYPDTVDVYTIYNKESGEVISRELCGGPHISDSRELGHFKIIKEQSSSAGIRRIKAILE